MTTSPAPTWLQIIANPLGALAVLVVALKWMTKQNETITKKFDTKEAAREIRENAREDARGEEIKTVAEALTTASIIRRDTRVAVEAVTKVVSNCQLRNQNHNQE